MKWVGPVIIAVAYILLVGFIIIWIGKETSNFAEFSQYWGLFGLIVGVITGAIPAFFFKAMVGDSGIYRAQTGNLFHHVARCQVVEAGRLHPPGQLADHPAFRPCIAVFDLDGRLEPLNAPFQVGKRTVFFGEANAGEDHVS